MRSYLLSKIEEGVARSTYRLHTAAIMKLEKALRMQGMAVPSFRPVIDDLAKAARALKQNHVPRAYVDPSALIQAITREPLRLVARLQYEGGARVREVALIKAMQLLGEEEDGLTGAIMGKVHLIHCKGGLERDMLVSRPHLWNAGKGRWKLEIPSGSTRRSTGAPLSGQRMTATRTIRAPMVYAGTSPRDDFSPAGTAGCRKSRRSRR